MKLRIFQGDLTDISTKKQTTASRLTRLHTVGPVITKHCCCRTTRIWIFLSLWLANLASSIISYEGVVNRNSYIMSETWSVHGRLVDSLKCPCRHSFFRTSNSIISSPTDETFIINTLDERDDCEHTARTIMLTCTCAVVYIKCHHNHTLTFP